MSLIHPWYKYFYRFSVKIKLIIKTRKQKYFLFNEIISVNSISQKNKHSISNAFHRKAFVNAIFRYCDLL